MNWNNLKQMKCPECERTLTKKQDGATAVYYICLKCNFKIYNKKFNELVNKMYRTLRTTDLDTDKNLSDLNNM